MTTTGPPADNLADRVESLESGQSKILGKLDELLGPGTSKAADPPAGPAGRPATVEEQVRAELKRRDDEAAAAAASAAEQGERKTLKDELAELKAKLAEAPPQQPQARRTRLMWGKQ